jgi:hypothetical protein
LCIAIWVPGKAVSVRFLLEQIWLQGEFRNIAPTEIYDLLIENDEEEPISKLFVLFPHFMTKEAGKTGTVLCQLPAGPPSPWGWYYRPSPSDEGSVRTLVVSDPRSGEALPLQGIVGADEARWCEELNSRECIDALQRIKKATFEITLNPPLEPFSLTNKGRWLRIIAGPRDLDVLTKPRIMQDGFGRPSDTCTWDLAVTCPSSVIEGTEKTLTLALKKDATNPTYLRLYSTIVGNGFKSPGTCVRIIDHRIVLGTMDPDLYILPYSTSSFDRVKLVGASSAQISHNGTTVPGYYMEWGGGACRNDYEDLFLVAAQLLHYSNFKRPIAKETLVSETTANKHRSAAILVDKMTAVGLFKKSDRPNQPSLYEPFFTKGTENNPAVTKLICDYMVKLRKLYRDPKEFLDFPEARSEFADTHRFSIPFKANWINGEGLRWYYKNPGKRILFWATIYLAIAGTVLGLSNLVIRILGAIYGF